MLYQMSNQNTGFEKVDETSLGNEGILERQDLQRIIRDQPEVIEPGLFIVAEEYSNWAESGKSIDLLGIGKDRNLVVVELKRGDSGEHMELQAIRYAAMAANMTLGQIVDAHRQYLEIRGLGEDAQDRIHGLLEAEDGVGEPQVATERPRILLVSEGFSKELTTSVLWLNDAGLDIRCVRLRGYRYGDGLLIDVDQVIPLPEAQGYLVQVRDRATESQKQRALAGRIVPGADDFEAAIADAAEKHQPTLQKLLRWARSLEKAGYAQLFSSIGSSGDWFGLSLRLPTDRAGLVWIWSNGGVPSLGFYRNVFERRAPKSIAPLEEMLGFKLKKGNETRTPGDRILELVTRAYKEANTPEVTERRAASSTSN